MAVKNISASVLARLRNQAIQENLNYQLCLQLFVQEEFLRRLSRSPYKENMVLKGGMFIYTLTEFKSRPTRDIDFLVKRLSNDPDGIRKVMEEICAVVPDAVVRKITTRLSDFEMPEIYTYSLESTIAEKVDAILLRMETTSRMKDFYDIYYLSGIFDFDGKILQKAILETMDHRGRTLETDTFDRIRNFPENQFLQTQWKAFTPAKEMDLSLEAAVNRLDRFIFPVLESVQKQNSFFGTWTCSNQTWISVDTEP